MVLKYTDVHDQRGHAKNYGSHQNNENQDLSGLTLHTTTPSTHVGDPVVKKQGSTLVQTELEKSWEPPPKKLPMTGTNIGTALVTVTSTVPSAGALTTDDEHIAVCDLMPAIVVLIADGETKP